jgi:hypothetical protein
MDIEKLRLVITEGEINPLLAERLPSDVTLEDLRVRLTPEGVWVLGKYPTPLLSMSFETLWSVTVAEGVVEARLENVKVAGLPAGRLRGILLRLLADSLPPQPGVHIGDGLVRVAVNEVLAARDVPLRLTLSRIECGDGRLTVVAGDA